MNTKHYASIYIPTITLVIENVFLSAKIELYFTTTIAAFVNSATATNMEAQLQTIWDEKLQRLSGGGASREENLVLFSQVCIQSSHDHLLFSFAYQVWDAVWPRLQPKDSLDYLSVTDGRYLSILSFTTLN